MNRVLALCSCIIQLEITGDDVSSHFHVRMDGKWPTLLCLYIKGFIGRGGILLEF